MNINDECIKKMCYLNATDYYFVSKKEFLLLFYAIDKIRRQCAK